MLIYRLLRVLFGCYFRIFHLLRIRGAARIPVEGGAILCANHSSWFDSMLVGVAAPRPVRFLITKEFCHRPIIGFFVRRCRAIPVNRNGRDIRSLREALAALERGELVAVFPEGKLSRTGEVSQPQAGAALLAARSGAPIVPVSLSGAFHVFPKGRKLPRPGRMRVSVHPPLVVPENATRETLATATHAMMMRISRRNRLLQRQTTGTPGAEAGADEGRE